MGQKINVENKKMILDFGYIQNVIFKDDLKRLDKIIAKLNILSVHNYSDLINFFRGAYVEKGYICLINSNIRKGKKKDETFLDAVLRIQLNDANQAWLEPGTSLGFYLDINLENPTLKVKNIFTTQMSSDPQPFETEFGTCPIEVVRFQNQIKPEQVIRECIINPYNAREISPLSNKFEIIREKWANYLSFFGWYLKQRQSVSELFLNLGYKKMIKVEKNEIRSKETFNLATIFFTESRWVYFEKTVFQRLPEVLNGKECNVAFADLLTNQLNNHHDDLKKQSELFITPLDANKNIENIISDKNALIDFAYSKKSDVNNFNLVLNWIGDEDQVDLKEYLMKTKSQIVNFFTKKEMTEWLRKNKNLTVTRSFLELNDSFTGEQLSKFQMGYIAFVGAGEDALLDRMREVLKKVSTGQSKNPYLINYLFNTNLISFNNYEEKIDDTIKYFHTLNDEQKLAVNKALKTKDIFVLQGPPGTGKTQVIAEIISQFALKQKKVLVSSQSNDAIQNVLERIPRDVNINAVRFINKSYNKQENLFSIDNIVQNYYKLLNKAITSNVDYDEQKLNSFYSMRKDLEDLILSSQGMHDTRNTLRKIKKKISENEISITKLKDKKISIAQNRVEINNEKFQAKNFIEALKNLNFNVAIENTKIIVRVFEKAIKNNFIQLVNDLNYTFTETNNVSNLFREIFDYIKTRDENFTKLDALQMNLKISRENKSDAEIKLYEHEQEYLIQEIEKNKFFKTFENITSDFVYQLQNELYNYEFEIIETGDEKFINNEIEKVNKINNDLELQVKMLQRQLSVIDEKIVEEIKKVNQEFKFDLSLLDPDMEEIAREKLNAIENNLKNKKRKKEFIGPLVNQINNYYRINYSDLENNEWMNYDAKKYYTSVFENLINVYAMTLSSPDKYKINEQNKIFKYGVEEISLKNIDVDVVIVDEASKANLLELFMALMYGKVLILVGDYRQLPPIINIHDDNVRDVNTKYKKNFNYNAIITLLEDAPFKNLIASNNKAMITTLKLQYRSHPDIVKVMNYFYGQELESDPIVELAKQHELKIDNGYRNLIDARSAVYWIDSSKNENDELAFEQSEGYSNSLYNMNEVKIAIQMIQKINEEVKRKNLKNKPSVAVINFYQLQVLKMKKEFEKISTKIDSINVVIDTVDAFQGREADYVLVSLVRNPQSLNNEYGREFLKRYERINVAFSRARKLLIIIGARRSISELMVDLPDYTNPNLINSRAVYDDIFTMLWNKNATLTVKEILGGK